MNKKIDTTALKSWLESMQTHVESADRMLANTKGLRIYIGPDKTILWVEDILITL